MIAYFGTVMASTLHYLCLWLAFGCCKKVKPKILLLNTELLFKDMPKEEIQTKFEHTDFIMDYIQIYETSQVLHNSCSHIINFSLNP